jgi:hypothetical protein
VADFLEFVWVAAKDCFPAEDEIFSEVSRLGSVSSLLLPECRLGCTPWG